MGASQRTKGAVYERHVARIFSDALGTEFKRNIGQARDGGNDIDVGPLVVECKRRKTLTTLEDWFEQALKAAMERPGKRTPVVVMKADHGTDFVLLRLTDFLTLTRDELLAHLGSQQPGLFSEVELEGVL